MRRWSCQEGMEAYLWGGGGKGGERYGVRERGSEVEGRGREG